MHDYCLQYGLCFCHMLNNNIYKSALAAIKFLRTSCLNFVNEKVDIFQKKKRSNYSLLTCPNKAVNIQKKVLVRLEAVNYHAVVRVSKTGAVVHRKPNLKQPYWMEIFSRIARQR